MEISPPIIEALVQLPLGSIVREYPNKLDHVLSADGDLLPPRVLHPAFYGSFDWHSAVHGHWALVRLLKLGFASDATPVRDALGAHLTQEYLAAEAAYLDRPEANGFERPYGWTWLLKLALELRTWNDPQGRKWSAWLRPLEERVVERYLEFFPKQTYPIRVGTHSNTAFGFWFALEFARATEHKALENMLVQRSIVYFAKDTEAPIEWEPSGADFLSPSLMEALLMSEVLGSDFERWFGRFMPDAAFTPAVITDRSDGQLAHLDGLNLSRAWCLKQLGKRLGTADLTTLAEMHLQAGLEGLSGGEYEGDHWLASFALLALED